MAAGLGGRLAGCGGGGGGSGWASGEAGTGSGGGAGGAGGVKAVVEGGLDGGQRRGELRLRSHMGGPLLPQGVVVERLGMGLPKKMHNAWRGCLPVKIAEPPGEGSGTRREVFMVPTAQSRVKKRNAGGCALNLQPPAPPHVWGKDPILG